MLVLYYCSTAKQIGKILDSLVFVVEAKDKRLNFVRRMTDILRA